jgi:glycosyltransferase involved in cell wall biosynthesis
MVERSSGRRSIDWAFVISSLAAGGAERVVIRLSQQLVLAGDRVTIVTFEPDGTDFFSLPEGVDRISLESSSGALGIRGNVARVRRLRRALQRIAPGVVVSFMTENNVLSVLASLGTSIPVILSERTVPGIHPERRVWQMLRSRLYPLADALVVQTRTVAGWAEARGLNRRILTIPNPVQSGSATDRVADRSIDRIGQPAVIAGLGRFTREKGFDQLIAACSSLRDRSARLVIAGDGPERDALGRQVDGLGLTGRVEFPGRIRDTTEFLSRADIFVLPSRYEGFPNALLEAMSIGRAVVAFDCPAGPREIVHDRVDGLLVTAGNVPALTEAIDELLADADLRQRLGAAARGVCDLFAPEVITRAWRSLAMEVVDHAGR